MQGNYGSNLVTSYNEIQSKTVRWLWYPFIAIGKITILQGDPGDGKSTMMLNLIAEISTGGATPDGKALGVPRRVLYQCSEDGLEDTIKPRLEKCGADCRNVGFINEETGGALTLDDERLRQAIVEYRPRLVVIDPIQAYIGGSADLQVAGRARKLMSRLSMWASVYECAIVLIGHLNKKEGQKDLYRSFGSIDVVAAARSVLQVERDEEDPCIRTVHQIKNSLGPTGETFSFEIRSETGFKWLGCDLSPEPQRLISEDKDKPQAFTTKMEKAAYLIKQLLADRDMSSKEIYERLKEQGIGHRTAEDTKKAIGVRCYRKMQSWYWSLKPKEEEK
ncbi:MAG: AAA family ATPase [Oscillospiraceae bacterium]|nr:AAA family ATPase [Oscillospiraceae bacterium]